MSRSLLLLIPALLCGCGELPTEIRPAVITAVYDPAASNLPTPNDLAMADGKVAIANNPLLTDAENLLKTGLNGKNGFSSASTARVQFSGAISAASITDETAVAFDLSADNARVKVTRTYADCDRSLTLASETGFTPGHTYLFAVTTKLKGAQGEEVAPSPAFYFLRAGRDLTQHPDALPGATRSEKAAAAERLEALRKKLEPHIQVLEANGIPRRELAALWTFTVHTEPEAYFDPTSRRIPFPNDLLLDAKTGLVSLPLSADDTPEQQKLKATLNQLDGFSTTAALSLSTTSAIDRASVNASTVKLFRADGAEVTDVERSVGRDGKKLVLQPRAPLLPATKYVVTMTGVKDTAGRTFAPMPLAQVLSLKTPIAEPGGRSRLSNLCDATASRLEPMRAVISKLADAPQAAWAFTTLDIAKHVGALWSTPYTAALPLQVFDAKVESGPLTMPSVGKIVTGKLVTLDRLDSTTRAFGPGPGTPRKIDFVLTLPRTAAPKVKVVVFGHGLYTARTLGIMLADRLARAGFAVLSIDFPLHGERTACLQNSHCALGGTCNADGTCTGAGLARLPPIPGAPGPGVPVATGQAWVDVENLGGTRDHFRQAIIDLSATMRLVRELDWAPVTGGTGLDRDQVHYAGISLGGIIGAMESGVDPNYRSLLLNVAGAGLVDLLRDSATFGPQLEAGLAQKGITRDSDAYDAFVNAARWVLDEVDPINVAQFARKRPLNGAAPKKLRLQMAIGDAVVPNSSTERLVKAIGLNESTELRSFIGSHAFLADPAEPACYVGQEDLVKFLEEN